MLDLRQHLFYFIAIFLMLGVGILVGASFYGPVQVRRQQTSLAHLRAEVDGAVQEGRDAKAQLAKTDAAIDALRPQLVHNKLTGRRIVLLQTGDYPEAAQDAAAALRDAGAPPAATLILGSDWNTLDKSVLSDNLDSLCLALIAGTADKERAANLRALEDNGLVVLTGTLDTPTVNFVIVSGSHEDGVSDADFLSELIMHLRYIGHPPITIAGCELYATDISDINTFQQASVATIDCIDRPLGALDLPFVLRDGPDTGNYGLRPTASLQIPPSLQETPAP